MYGLRKNSDYNLPGGSNKKSASLKRQRNIILGVVALIFFWYFFRGSSETKLSSKTPTYPSSFTSNDGTMPTPTGNEAINSVTLIEDAIRRNKVVVFAKSYCGFCKSTIEILAPMVDNMYILNLDKHEGGEQIQEALGKKFSQTTVPYIIINREFIGGNSDLLKIQNQDNVVIVGGSNPEPSKSEKPLVESDHNKISQIENSINPDKGINNTATVEEPIQERIPEPSSDGLDSFELPMDAPSNADTELSKP